MEITHFNIECSWMGFYRIYEIDAFDRIATWHMIGAEDDIDALRRAKSAIREGITTEVWQQSRLIGKLVAQPSEIDSGRAREQQ